MAKPPKIDRKELKTPDTFVQKGRHWLGLIASQKTRFFPILLAVLVIVGGVYGYEWWSNRALDKAWDAYNAAGKHSEPEVWEKLRQFHSKYRRSRPGFLAAVALGDHAYDEKKAGSAFQGSDPGASSVEWYSNALTFSGMLPQERQLILINRGKAYELSKKWDDALNDFKKAGEEPGELRAIALLNVARAYELKDDVKQALETLEKVTVDYLNTPYANLAKNSIRRLKSPLFQSKRT